MFHSSHNNIPIKQSQSQLITGVACGGKQIPRHESGSVEQYPALRKKHCSVSVCFSPGVFQLPSLFGDKKELGGRWGMRRNEEQERGRS